MSLELKAIKGIDINFAIIFDNMILLNEENALSRHDILYLTRMNLYIYIIFMIQIASVS